MKAKDLRTENGQPAAKERLLGIILLLMAITAALITLVGALAMTFAGHPPGRIPIFYGGGSVTAILFVLGTVIRFREYRQENPRPRKLKARDLATT